MGLVEHISHEQQQAVTNTSTYDEQNMAAKLDAIKRCLKQFLTNTHNYADFADRVEIKKVNANALHTTNKVFITPPNRIILKAAITTKYLAN